MVVGVSMDVETAKSPAKRRLGLASASHSRGLGLVRLSSLRKRPCFPFAISTTCHLALRPPRCDWKLDGKAPK
ncbi:hypothetical protein CCHR01_18279 [Colletotrichum chrysophilum]|uniref:Uncharacterized protein n=1 Tax=Colletotrichum chrysophilum TaxID=1836956 RepID=A0AAD9A0C7_9PEZI|nr:hypothetical protein CCHR01_18279 [Colletotrichum chrysophilum]